MAAGLYLGLMLLSGLVIKFTLAGTALDRIIRVANGRSPVPVEIASGDFSILEWLRLRPVLTLSDLRVGNPEGYSIEPMLAAESLNVQVGLASLLTGRIRVLEVALDEPLLTIEANDEGRTNIQALFDGFARSDTSSSEPAPASEGRDIAVDSVCVQSGTVRYAGPNTPPFAVNDLDAELANVSLNTPFEVHVDAALLGSNSSRLRFEGEGGPRSNESLPAHGSLLVELRPDEIPAEIRSQYFGAFLGAPGGDSSIILDAEMDGDLFAEFSGDGRLTFLDLRIGRDADHQLPLSGEAPLHISTQTLLGKPSAMLESPDASLALGEGQWQGEIHIGYGNTEFQAASDGSVSGVRIEEMLGAFTHIENAVSGLAEIPNYSLRASGANADEMRDSLAGNGRVELTEGRVALFDLASTIERHARKLLTGEAPAEGETSFLRFETNFDVADARVRFTDLALAGESVGVTGSGTVGFDNALNFALDTTVRGQVAGLLGARPDDSGEPTATLPVTVTGTLDSPRVRPDLGRVVMRKALGLLESLLGGDE